MNFKEKFYNIRKTIQAYRAGQIDRRIIRKFILIAGSITGAYLILASVVTISLLAANSSPRLVQSPIMPSAGPSESFVNGQIAATTAIEEDDGGIFRPPSRTNVLILGVDEAYLADVVIVGSFERDTGYINLLSIPRDTFTQLPQSRIDEMTENGLWVPNHGRLKINAMRSLSRRRGVDFGPQFMMAQLSETLGIEFHYYVEFDLAAFRAVVDLVGGVEIEVPRRMFYEDPYQNLFINIPAGLQVLDGRMAEYFVRYRSGYADQDLGRIRAQQQFMTQLFRQALRRETIMSDPVAMARIGLSYVNHNAGVMDVMRYVPYIANLSPDRINTYTLPHTDGRVAGIWYIIPDNERVPEVINRMFFGVESVPQIIEDEPEPVAIPVMAATGVRPSRGARIAVLNGTQIGGVAMNVADMLNTHGYQIVHLDIYRGNHQNQTRINVREEGMGYDLIDYFENAAVRLDTRMSSDFDIVIIVGRSEQ